MERNVAFPSKDTCLVHLKLTWAQAEVVSTKSDQFQLLIAGDDDSIEELRIEQSGEDLIVAQPQLAYAKEILPRRRWLQICLRMPEDWRGDLDVDTIAGTVGAHGIQAGDISLSTVAGSMNVYDIVADRLSMHSVTGAISGRNLRAKRGTLRSVSGAIAAEGVRFPVTKVFTVSSSVTLQLESGCKTVDAQSMSGSLTIYTNEPVRAALHALSGQFIREEDVADAPGGIEVSATSVSGDLAIKRKEEK